MKVLLAKKWTGQDLREYYMSEKLDGVRAIWTGAGFISRNGKTFDVPQWYCDQFPRNSTLDGELFLGPGRFNEVAGACRRKKENCDDEIWKSISYCVFDAPMKAGTFEARLGWLEHLSDAYPAVRVVDHYSIYEDSDLEEFYKMVLDGGGEGVMLRRKGSRYESKRSSTLLKVKPHNDEEATVIGHEGGSGKHEGRLGAYVCRLSSGAKFRLGVGISDLERENPAPVGSALTVRYQELTPAGKPRFPVFVGVRNYE